MKKKLVNIACLVLLATTAFAAASNEPMPNEKVIKNFLATFASAQQVKWFDFPDHYEVSFLQTGIRATVRYDTEGNFISSRRYYQEQQLPAPILSRLKKKYPDKTVVGVSEITNNDQVNYYIKMSDDKHWITVKASADGQMEQYEKYKKA